MTRHAFIHPRDRNNLATILPEGTSDVVVHVWRGTAQDAADLAALAASISYLPMVLVETAEGWREHRLTNWQARQVGAEPGYPLGAHVRHLGVVWVNRRDNSYWVPGDLNSGWVRFWAAGEEPTWAPDTQYEAEVVVVHLGVRYRALVDEFSEVGREPNDPVMWAVWEDLTPPVDIPAWVQPTGSHDAYPAGAEVTHNGRHWLNSHGDGNVWEPGVFGWTDLGPAP